MEGQLCSICQDIDLQQYLFQDACPGTVTLGGFQDILKKEKCSLCRLIIKALSANSRDHWEKDIYPSEVCYLGRQDGRTQPSVVEVWFDSTSETLPKGMSGHSTTRGEILLVTEESETLSRKPTNLGRQVGSQIDLALLREWLSNCESGHGEKCGGSARNDQSTEPHPLILVDVERRRLVECNSSYRYVVLSYVWGQVPTFQTLQANFSGLQEDGALTRVGSEIPRVIRDAMDVVAGLGERYLWVDALCIIQDGASKMNDISRMDAIYGGAVLTIIAIAGLDANTSLPGLHPGSRSNGQSRETIGGMCLINKLPELSGLLQASRWESRGWTFQERILSRRCFYFTDSQVYFQCRSSICREDIFGEYSQNQLIASGATNPLEMDVSPTDGEGRLFNIYQNMVKSYNRRELSYQSDALNAFSGIISVLQKRFGWRFLSALPEDVFHLSLLWRPMVSSSPRYVNIAETLGHPSTVFPSWCWTSRIGDMYWDPWRTDAYAGNAIRLESEIEKFVVRNGTGFRNVETKFGNAQTGRSISTRLPPSSALAGVDSIDETALLQERSLPHTQVLYFWAQAVRLDVLSLSFEKTLPDNHPISSRQKMTFYNQSWLYDAAGHHCGTLIGIESWPPGPSYEVTKYELLLLSRSHQKVVTEADIKTNLRRLPLEYPSSQEYYDEMFDTNHFTPTEDWSMNIMLVEWKGEYAERVAVGQIHADAWERSSPQRRFVRLA